MGTASRITGDFLVPFGYLIFYCVIQVGKGGAHHGGVLLDALGAVPVLAAGRIMVYEVGGEKLVFRKERLTLSRRPGFRSCRMLTESAGTYQARWPQLSWTSTRYTLPVACTAPRRR